jgi:acetyl esterase/lipase
MNRTGRHRTIRTFIRNAAIRCSIALLIFSPSVAQPESKDARVIVVKDIIYAERDGLPLRLDLARPAQGGPSPLVVCIHGGGWQKGSKDLPLYQQLIRELALRGYVAASVEYRRAPVHKFPAQVLDVKCAVQFLRAHAQKYSIDPERIAALGHSAGGYLSSMLGLTDTRDGLVDGSCHPDHSSRVQAVVNYYGGMDLSTWSIGELGESLIAARFGGNLDDLIRDFTAAVDRNDPVLQRASPATYADSKDPPVLTLHGTVDPLLPLDEGKRFHRTLKAAGVDSRLEIVEGGAHGWEGDLKERTDAIVFEFLELHLKAKLKDQLR